MTRALQQQVFSLDAHYNANRTCGNPQFRTLYIRRRSQLLRETGRDTENWKQYIRLRSILLQQKYGSVSTDTSSLNSSHSNTNLYDNQSHSNCTPGRVVPTRQAEASRALVGGNSIADNYAFTGVHHIFDQHTGPVTMVKFAHNDKSTLGCSSVDTTLSICNVTSQPPVVSAVFKGHKKAVTGFDWSSDNDLIVSSSLDGTCRVWKVSNHTCLRIVEDSSQMLCCLFQPINNNIFISGNNKGELKMANISTGRFLSRNKIGGSVLCLAADPEGRLIWAGNDRGEIYSLFYAINGGFCKTKKLSLPFQSLVTSLSYRAWISREARDPLLLVNSTDNSLRLFSVLNLEGGLQLKRKFQNRHKKFLVRSAFCPLMSFRQGACIVTGSEDGTVYFMDVEKFTNKSVVNTLQGHSSAILGVSFNYDESLLATCDSEGLIIIWKRKNFNC